MKKIALRWNVSCCLMAVAIGVFAAAMAPGAAAAPPAPPAPKKAYVFQEKPDFFIPKYFATQSRVFIGHSYNSVGAYLGSVTPLLMVDGVTDSAQLLTIPNRGGRIIYPVAAGENIFYFFAYGPDGATEETLWCLRDGQSAPELLHTFGLDDCAKSTLSTCRTAATLGDILYFRYVDATVQGHKHAALWKSDGSVAGTERLALFRVPRLQSYSMRSVFPGGLMALGNRMIFNAFDETMGLTLWVTDGTPGGTQAAFDLFPPNPAYPFSSDSYGAVYNYGYSQEGYALLSATLGYSSGADYEDFDGGTFTANFLVEETTDGEITAHRADAASMWPLVRIGDSDYGIVKKAAFDIDRMSINVSTHTVSLSPLASAQAGDIGNSVTINDKVIFCLDTDESGKEPWILDPVTEQTSLLKDIYPGTEKSMLSYGADWMIGPVFATCGGYAYFEADDGQHGPELWRTNGEAAGTEMVQDLSDQPYRPDVFYVSPFAHKNKLYFIERDGRATTPENERGKTALWVIDHGAGQPEPSVRIIPSASQVEVGGALTLRVAASGLIGHLSHEWFKDGRPLDIFESTLIFRNLGPLHEGSYTVRVYDDSKAIFESPPYVVTVLPEGSLPLHLALPLLFALGGAGALVLRRRR